MKLIKSPDPILLQTAIAWDFATDSNAAEVEESMVDLMINSNHAIGLAANQVGLTKRVFALQLQNHPTMLSPFAMFNPILISVSTEIQIGLEGCLSFPDLWLEIKRPILIDVEYFDKFGIQCILQLNGIDARCFLHELDHLNGICFTQKVSQLKLAMAQKKQFKRKQNGRTK